MMNLWLLAILVVASYFLGNISFGRILASKHKVDITKKGSGNPGATNVFRNVSRKTGWLVLFLDSLKGIIPSLVGLLVFGIGTTEGTIALYSCGLGAVVGHIFPVLFKFKGGKGVSTVMGVFLVAQPLPMLVLFVLAFCFVWLFKYLSLASLFIVSIMVIWQNLFYVSYSPFEIGLITEPNLVIALLTLSLFLLVWYAHRSNIERLLQGKETKTNISKKLEKDEQFVQKQNEKALEHAKKVEIKYEKEEVKAELKEAKAEINAELKEAKQGLKKERKEIKSTKKQIIKSVKQKKKSKSKQAQKKLKQSKKHKKSSKNIKKEG